MEEILCIEKPRKCSCGGKVARMFYGMPAYSVQPTPYWHVKENGRELSDIYDETYPIEDNDY